MLDLPRDATLTVQHPSGWSVTLTLEELAVWMEKRVVAVLGVPAALLPVEGDGLPLGQALALEHEERVRQIAQEEVKRAVSPSVRAGRKGGR